MRKPETVTSMAAVVGAVLIQMRKNRKLTQEDVGKEAGVRASTWSRIEAGLSQLSTEQLRAAAKVLGTTASAILEAAERIEEGLRDEGVKVQDSASMGPAAAAKDASGAARAIPSSLGALCVPLAGAALANLIAPMLMKKMTKSPGDK